MGGGNPLDFGFQYLPESNGQVFGAGHLVLHEGHIEVEVFVVNLVDDMGPNERAELLEVDNKTGFRVGFSLHGHDEVEIMAVPISVGTGAEHLTVPLLAPLRIVELVGRVEVFLPTDVNHWELLVDDRMLEMTVLLSVSCSKLSGNKGLLTWANSSLLTQRGCKTTSQEATLPETESRHQPLFRSKYTKNGTPNRAVTNPTGKPAGG